MRRYRGFKKKDREKAVYDAAATYRRLMLRFSDMGNMEVWYKHLDLEELVENDALFADERQQKVMRETIDQYEPLELAHKVVGVGSVGLQAWLLILMGKGNGDPLVLQIKQAYADQNEADYEMFLKYCKSK